MSDRAGLPASYDTDLAREPDTVLMADLTPAGELTAAAALIRERAAAATPGPWHAFSHERDWYVGSRGYGQVTTGTHDEPDVAALVLIERDRADAAHIAGMHPAFALAVADLLDAASTCECEEGDDHWQDKSAALAVARAYLDTEG